MIYLPLWFSKIHCHLLLVFAVFVLIKQTGEEKVVLQKMESVAVMEGRE